MEPKTITLYPLYPSGALSQGEHERMYINWKGIHPLQGTINVPEKVIQSPDFWLIQLHELMHAYYYPYRDEIYEYFVSYIYDQMRKGRINSGDSDIYVPIMVRKEDVNKVPPILKVIYKMKDGGAVISAKMNEAGVAHHILLSQCEELFVDFFSTAAAGIAYWETVLDFEVGCDENHVHWTKSSWDPHYPHLYEPHPVPCFRFRLLPEIMCKHIGATLINISKEEAQSAADNLNQEIKTFMSSKISNIKGDVAIYSNNAAPPEVVTISMPMQIMRQYYELACEAFRSLMTKWFNTSHPLAMFVVQFSRADHQNRIVNFRKQFEKEEIPLCDSLFDQIVIAAAARSYCDLKRNNINPKFAEIVKETFNRSKGRVQSFITYE
jgi:hypothetical protein